MWKKGHVRRNWTERWFVLKPSSMSYYVSEALKDKKGEIQLDKSCVVEVGRNSFAFFSRRRESNASLCRRGLDSLLFRLQPIPDREGKRCLFCVKTDSKTYEMSAADQRQKVEWVQGALVCMNSDAHARFNHLSMSTK